MSQSGATPIQIYSSTTPSAAPSAVNLLNGELAINITDGKLYYKDNAGAVQTIAVKLPLPVANGGTASTTAAAAKIALAVVSSATGSEIIPSGTTAQRDAAPATGYLRFNTSNVAFEGYTGAAWSSIGGGGAALSNDTATASDIYPTFAAATSGTPTNLYTSNAKLLYKPSTGEFKANAPVALNGLNMNATTVNTSYTIATGYNAHSVGPITLAASVVVTISSGQRWLVS